jgi:hypothetical protein
MLMQNDIEPSSPNAINVSKIKPEDKFIPYKMCSECFEMHPKGISFQFTHDLLTCEKLTVGECLNAACNMDMYLQKHIESEVERLFNDESLLKMKAYIDKLIFDKKMKIRTDLRNKLISPIKPENYSEYVKPKT